MASFGSAVHWNNDGRVMHGKESGTDSGEGGTDSGEGGTDSGEGGTDICPALL